MVLAFVSKLFAPYAWDHARPIRTSNSPSSEGGISPLLIT
jgi:hypothetical protein